MAKLHKCIILRHFNLNSHFDVFAQHRRCPLPPHSSTHPPQPHPRPRPLPGEEEETATPALPPLPIPLPGSSAAGEGPPTPQQLRPARRRRRLLRQRRPGFRILPPDCPWGCRRARAAAAAAAPAPPRALIPHLTTRSSTTRYCRYGHAWARGASLQRNKLHLQTFKAGQHLNFILAASAFVRTRRTPLALSCLTEPCFLSLRVV